MCSPGHPCGGVLMRTLILPHVQLGQCLNAHTLVLAGAVTADPPPLNGYHKGALASLRQAIRALPRETA